METYLEKLLSQIRCKKARPYIAEEIRDHIECQIADNLSEGMSYEEAEKNAVTDMGDPVEVGISLDRIHKPKIAWKLLVIVGILSPVIRSWKHGDRKCTAILRRGLAQPLLLDSSSCV